MIRLTVAQGALLSRTLQANTLAMQPVIGKYVGTDTIHCLLWPAGASQDSALAVVPTGSWLTDAGGDPNYGANLGQWVYTVSPSQSAALEPGTYKTSAKATHGTEVDDLLEGELTITGTGGAALPPSASPVSGASATMLALVPTLYCTDEDVVKRCYSDFTGLLPDSMMLAWGSDGVFSASDPWTLTSPSTNFTNQLQPIWTAADGTPTPIGYVVWLRKPQSAFPAGGILMAVAAVSGSSITLRRLNLPSGWGLAPSPARGLAGVEFQVCTFYPQIENASYETNLKYRIDATIQRRAPMSITDLRVLRAQTVAMVLLDRYSSETRDSGGDYAHKIDLLKNELSDLRATLTIRWLTGLDSAPQTGQFYTRLVR
jgi:hypothetical protein